MWAGSSASQSDTKSTGPFLKRTSSAPMDRKSYAAIPEPSTSNADSSDFLGTFSYEFF